MAETTPLHLKGVVQFGVFDVNLAAREVRKHGTRVRLQGQPFAILALLLERPAQIITREQIRERLWPLGTFVDFEHSLNAAIKKLRTALGDSVENSRYIETIPRIGYRFIAPVGKTELTAPVGETASSSGRSAKVEPSAGIFTPIIRSLAVLPLENLSGDPAHEYFADGITDELITHLARIRGLRVISRTSSMQFKGTRKSARQIGRKLGVDGLLQGTLERSGQRVRIRAQLIHAPTDCHRWTQTYDRELTDILTLESELAQDVAEQIKAHVASELTPASSKRTMNPVAFEHYLRAKHFFNRKNIGALEKAIEEFCQVIRVEPAYAPAYAGLASSHCMLAYLAGSYREHIPLARTAAEQAVRLDSTLSEAHTALAQVATSNYNFRDAEREHQLAVSMGPNDAAAHWMYACSHLVVMGRFEQANQEMAQALRLEPVSVNIATSWAAILVLERRYDEATNELNKVLEMSPEFAEAYLWRGLNFLFQGKHPEAIADLERMKRYANTPRTLGLVGYGLGLTGQRSKALDILAKLNRMQAYVSPMWFAFVYLGLEDNDHALAWLEKACNENCSELTALNVLPAYDLLRKNPRFQALVARVGLPL